MRKSLLFMVPVAMAAPSLSAATAFADAPPANQHGGGSPDCAAARQAAQAKLQNDQAALDAAQQTLNRDIAAANDPEGHQPWRQEDIPAARAEVENLQAVVQADQAGTKQTPDACKNTTDNSSPTTTPPTSKPSGAASSGSSSRVPSEGPGLPETDARG